MTLMALKTRIKAVFAARDPVALARTCCGGCGSEAAHLRTEDEDALIASFYLAAILSNLPDGAFAEHTRALALRAAGRVDADLAPWLHPSPTALIGLKSAYAEMVEGIAYGNVPMSHYDALDPEFASAPRVRAAAGHVSIGLEFYARLLDRLGTGGAADEERASFLTLHLGPLVISLADDPKIVAQEFYGRVFGWCRNLVAAECAALGLSLPSPASAAPRTSRAVGCGSGGRCGCA